MEAQEGTERERTSTLGLDKGGGAREGGGGRLHHQVVTAAVDRSRLTSVEALEGVNGARGPVLPLPAVETEAFVQCLLIEGLDVPSALEPLHHAALLQFEHDLHAPQLSMPWKVPLESYQPGQIFTSIGKY